MYGTDLEDDKYWLFDTSPENLRLNVALFEPPPIMSIPPVLRPIHPDYRGSASASELELPLSMLPEHWWNGDFPDWLVILDHRWIK